MRVINPLQILEELVSLSKPFYYGWTRWPKITTGYDNIKVENVWYEITNPIIHDRLIVAVIYRFHIHTKVWYNAFTKEVEKS